MAADNIEQAVLLAINFFQRMYGDKGLKDVLLEEVREKDDGKWDVTIGYSRLIQDSPPLTAIAQGPKYERVYKSILVDKASGNIEGLLARKL